MKVFISMTLLIFSLSALADDREKMNLLLSDKGTTIAAFEAQGMRLVMGERTGGGRNLQFASVEVIFTHEEAILKNEIQDVQLRHGRSLGHLESVQAGGRQIEAGEIIGVITK